MIAEIKLASVFKHLAIYVPGALPAEAAGFFGRKNPHHAFLRKGSKAVSPMSQICGM
jgi:hypothetical protein